MQKYYNDKGQVAVLYSPGYGAGWYSWNIDIPECLFDPEIVQMILDKKDKIEIKSFVESKYPSGYWGGADDLKIVWIDKGTLIRIDEYDGYEYVKVRESEEWIYV